MTIYYSFVTLGFYDDAINFIPEDAVEITNDLRTLLIRGQSDDGKIIVMGPDGLPMLSDPPPPTAEQITARNSIQQESLLYDASKRMAPVLVSLQLGDATDDETVLAKAWQSYYRALKLVDLTVSSPMWPDPPASV
ncbi:MULTISPECIES: tail fiber assembly protein [unclassified Pseudomonas]|uniref:tail fiber assembly protein n=1 Tax=unclassified Pseudomonas TaxID=196821 RepID=UPI0016125FD7|nr:MULTISPECIES: tail fiber assembly protein [unclassified Pseudomonas]MBB6286153.1 hypothetical protein [Pseudomonas sp. SJZ073]MBB6311922.1 hypothetical protein [Pseudomonas sp. JAI120]